MKGVRLVCPFCGHKHEPRRLVPCELEWLAGEYMSHLVMKHWDVLEAAHQLALGLRGLDDMPPRTDRP